MKKMKTITFNGEPNQTREDCEEKCKEFIDKLVTVQIRAATHRETTLENKFTKEIAGGVLSQCFSDKYKSVAVFLSVELKPLTR